MNCLLFVLEVALVVVGIALVPRQSELRICRTRVEPVVKRRTRPTHLE
jgi:hypothetical protein